MVFSTLLSYGASSGYMYIPKLAAKCENVSKIMKYAESSVYQNDLLSIYSSMTLQKVCILQSCEL